MNKKGEEHHDHIERKGHPELGKGDEENISKVSLIHFITSLACISWMRSEFSLAVGPAVAIRMYNGICNCESMGKAIHDDVVVLIFRQ